MRDSASAVKRTAIWALTQMDDESARDAFVEMLQSDDPGLRATAARALGHGHVNPQPRPQPRPAPRPFP
jgi:HEAT repeat protein